MNSRAIPPDGYDTLLMCGEGATSRAVGAERNKSFLTIEGLPLFIHILKTLETSRFIRRVFIVGDKKRTEKALAMSGVTFTKPVIPLQQWGNLAQNIWNGFLSTIDDYQQGDEERRPDVKEKVIFALPGDSPLVGRVEIEEFITGAEMSRYDHVIGFTPLKSLEPYRATATQPGISMTGYHVAEGVLRINNLHISRPAAFANRRAVQQMYESRYQKQFGSVLRLAWDIFSYPKVRNRFHLHLLTHLALQLHNAGFERLSRWVRSRVSLAVIIEGVDDICGIRTGYRITRQGGAALDIDNEDDYQTMRQRFSVWRRMQGD